MDTSRLKAPRTRFAPPPPDSLGLRLESVQVLIRHGVRTPISVLNGISGDRTSKWNCDCHYYWQLKGIHNNALDEHHYQKNGSVAVPPDGVPNVGGRGLDHDKPMTFRKAFMHNRQKLPGNCFLGQLTPEGMRDMRHLGELIKDRYVSELSFLPPAYDPDLLHVRSTDSARTIESAQWLLYGLFSQPAEIPSPSSDPPISINTVERYSETMYPRSSCKKYAQLWADMRTDLVTNDSPVWSEWRSYRSELFGALHENLREFHSSMIVVDPSDDEDVDDDGGTDAGALSFFAKRSHRFISDEEDARLVARDVPTTEVGRWAGMYNTLSAAACYGSRLPPTVVQALELVRIESNLEYLARFNDPISVRIGIGRFVAEVMSDMEGVINSIETGGGADGNSNDGANAGRGGGEVTGVGSSLSSSPESAPILRLYSGHDNTLAPFLAGFGIFGEMTKHWRHPDDNTQRFNVCTDPVTSPHPPMGSFVILELYSRDRNTTALLDTEFTQQPPSSHPSSILSTTPKSTATAPLSSSSSSVISTVEERYAPTLTIIDELFQRRQRCIDAVREVATADGTGRNEEEEEAVEVSTSPQSRTIAALQRSYYVRMIYNGRAVPVEGCGNLQYCPLEMFMGTAGRMVPRTYAEECRLPSSKSKAG